MARVENVDNSLQLRLVTSEGDLDRLAGPWQALLAASAAPELMQDFRWLRAWWRHYGAGRALAAGTFHDGDRLVGIAPCCRRTFSHRFGIRLQRLELMGAGEGETDGVCSEYLGLIAGAGYEQRVAEAFVAAVVDGRFGPWHECVLEMMHGDGAMVAHLARSFDARGFGVECRTTMEAPFVALPPDWGTFERTLGKKRRQAIKYALRDFVAWAGERGYALHRASDAPSFEHGFAILRRLHAERWRMEGLPSVFDAPRFIGFHDEVARRLLACGQLELIWLAVGGEPVAAHYSFNADGRIHFYQSGRRMDVPNNVRLGIVMMALVIQDAISRGLREIDMLGGKAQYKMLFTHTTRPLVRIRVARPGWREQVRRALVRGRDLVRTRRLG